MIFLVNGDMVLFSREVGLVPAFSGKVVERENQEREGEGEGALFFLKNKIKSILL